MAWTLLIRMDGDMLMAPEWLTRVFFGHIGISPVVPTCSGHLTSLPLLVGWFLAYTM